LLTETRRSAITAGSCTNVIASYQSGQKTYIRSIFLLLSTDEDGRWDVSTCFIFASLGICTLESEIGWAFCVLDAPPTELGRAKMLEIRSQYCKVSETT
jgi:hypothetical protein